MYVTKFSTEYEEVIKVYLSIDIDKIDTEIKLKV